MMETYADSCNDKDPYFIELRPNTFDRNHKNSQAHIKVKVRMERFLSIWEEEGCCMVAISCANNDTYAENSQFITHLIGQMMGSQGLAPTPIDTEVSLHLNSCLLYLIFIMEFIINQHPWCPPLFRLFGLLSGIWKCLKTGRKYIGQFLWPISWNL